MKNYLKILSVIIGTMIGAGFASGKEIYLFFGSYGIYGILGILLSSLLTSFIVYRAFIFIRHYSINSYFEFTQAIFHNMKPYILHFFNAIITLFLFVSFIIMIAGFGACIEQELQIPTFIGSLLLALVSFFLLNRNVNGIMRLNSFLIPILIFLVLYFSLKNLSILSFSHINNFLSSSSNFSWIISAILYSSYNSILLIPILIPMQKSLSNRKAIKLIAFSCFIILSLLSFCIISLLMQLLPSQVTQIEIPILSVMKSFGSIYEILYGIIILIAILTSAISAGYSFMQVFHNKPYYRFISFFVCFVAPCFSHIGFSKLISILYPFFGFLGIIQILSLLLKKKPKTDINDDSKR